MNEQSQDGKPDAARQHELYERALEGDTAAFWELVKPSQRIIFAAAVGIMRNQEQAEDVVHDVYVRAFSTLGSLRSPASLSFWLFSMSRNIAHEHLRKFERQEKIKSDPRNQPAVISVPDMLVREEELQILHQAMQDLPEAHRVVLGLKYMEHHSCKEIAEALGIGVEAAKSRLFEARKLLAKRMRAVERAARFPAASSSGVQKGGV